MVWRRLLRDSRCDGKKAVVCGALCNLPDVLLLLVNESDWVKGRREKGRRGESGVEKRGGIGKEEDPGWLITVAGRIRSSRGQFPSGLVFLPEVRAKREPMYTPSFRRSVDGSSDAPLKL